MSAKIIAGKARSKTGKYFLTIDRQRKARLSNLLENLRGQTLYVFMAHLSEAYTIQIALIISLGRSNDLSWSYLILLANGLGKGEEESLKHIKGA